MSNIIGTCSIQD